MTLFQQIQVIILTFTSCVSVRHFLMRIVPQLKLPATSLTATNNNKTQPTTSSKL